MTDSASDIHMEDGNPDTSDQYFPEIGGLNAVSASNEYLMTELATNTFEQLPVWHHYRFPHSSTSLLLPLDQPSVPEQRALESDMFYTPDMSQDHKSTSKHYDATVPAFDISAAVYDPVSQRISQIIGT